MNSKDNSRPSTKSYPPKSRTSDATRAHLHPFVAQPGVNVTQCPRCQKLNEARGRHDYHGNVFIPISFWLLSRIKNNHPVKFHVKCHSEAHQVVLTGIV